MIKVRNTTNQEIILLDTLLREAGTEGDTYEIPSLVVPQWANDDEVLQNIANENIVLSLNDVDITSTNDAIDILKDNITKEVKSTHQPFADKVLLDGKKIFTRVIGYSSEVGSFSENIDYTVTFSSCKITGVELINTDIGDTITLQVLDTSTGTISGTPNAMLNEFGTDVNMTKDYYKYESSYDADLIQDMKIRIIYDALDSLLPKKIRINLYLHEVV